MSKHPYATTCDCPRCTRERARRTIQSASDPRTVTGRFRTRRFPAPQRLYRAHNYLTQAQAVERMRRPVPGSQEWAETRGDDLGPSED